ncbi:MAG: hypothetical protein OEX02_19890 [Cyclobacteriaceae bacterium]|nr:hypothetical protein [Cyclobacteriaceae bacterium]
MHGKLIKEMALLFLFLLVLGVSISIYVIKNIGWVEGDAAVNKVYECMLKEYDLEFKGKIIKVFSNPGSRRARYVLRHKQDLTQCRRTDKRIAVSLDYALFGLFEYVDDTTVVFEGTSYTGAYELGDIMYISTRNNKVVFSSRGNHSTLVGHMSGKYETRLSDKELINSEYNCE